MISYSHDSPAHSAQVLELANGLRSNGIETILDQYDPWPLEDWPAWMSRELNRADRVLLVCTMTYRRRFEGGEVPGKGRGATHEGHILRTELYQANGQNERMVPVLFDDEPETSIPAVLRGHSFHRLPAGREDLLRRLRDARKVRPANPV
jgi:hypothetical protein